MAAGLRGIVPLHDDHGTPVCPSTRFPISLRRGALFCLLRHRNRRLTPGAT